MRTRKAVILLTLVASVASAQPAAPRPVVKPAADSIIVSLLTLGPGRELFDRFGHTAIRVRKPLSGLDSAWNWGMYDFNAPNFIPRFLTGDTEYWMAGYATYVFVNHYRENRRDVWEQELALTPAQADSLLRFLRWNALPENKFYRYDYYLDNCSTRARDALDGVLGGVIRSSLEPRSASADVTYRRETLRLSQAFPFIAFGMSYTLGPRADVPVSPWNEGFIPMRLRDRLREVSLADSGGTRSLVARERKLVDAGQYVEAASVPDYQGRAVMVGIILAAVILRLGLSAGSSGAARLALGAIGSTWHLVAGIAGTLVLSAGLFTRHVFMGANTAVLLGTPVSLVLIWFYARGWSHQPKPGTLRVAAMLSYIAAIAATVALLAQLAPGIAPADAAPLGLAFPVHAALAFVMRGRAKASPA